MDTTDATEAQIRRWRRYLAEERMEAQTYRNLAARQQGHQREIMLELAEAEGRHEAHWVALLGDRAEPPPPPALIPRLRAALAARFGSIFVLALAQRSEQRTAYDLDGDAPNQMAADEHIHGEVVRSLAAESRSQIAGPFRAGVFGANDGLVSNLALILGVVATGMDTNHVLAAGVAGLLAGSLSMGAGEWISVSSQRELLDASKPDPHAHRSVPALDVDANELALVFRARGLSREDAQSRAAKIFATLGDPESTQSASIPLTAALVETDTAPSGADASLGTPWQAGISSFIFFAMGALIPLLPYLFGMTGTWAAIAAGSVVGVALLFTGGLVGLLSGKRSRWAALRQLGVGYGAAAITYALGSWFGAVTA